MSSPFTYTTRWAFIAMLLFSILAIDYVSHYFHIQSKYVVILFKYLYLALIIHWALDKFAKLTHQHEQSKKALLDTQSRLEDSIYDLKQVLNFSPDPIIIADEQLKVVHLNAAALNFFEATDEHQLIGQSIDRFGITQNHYLLREWVKTKRKTDRPLLSNVMTTSCLSLTGKSYTVQFSFSPLLFGQQKALIFFGRDLTEQNRFQREVDDIRKALDESAIVTILDANGIIKYANDKFCLISQYSMQELVGQPLAIINSPYYDHVQYDRMWSFVQAGQTWRGEVQSQAKDSTLYWVDRTIVPFLDEQGFPYQYIVISTEITARKVAEHELILANAKLLNIARIDGLTGIANRRAFEEKLQQEWNLHAQTGAPLSIIMIDVDHFKKYNDYYGHLQGDTCLKELASLVKEVSTRHDGFVARYGGEELIVLLPNADEQRALQITQMIRASIAERAIPHDKSPTSMCVTISIGIATATTNQFETIEQLITAADHALYQSKREGRNRATLFNIFSNQLDN